VRAGLTAQREGPPELKGISRAGLSKLSSVRVNNIEVDVILGELNSRTEANFHQRVQRLPE
jgi:hypothetical protein